MYEANQSKNLIFNHFILIIIFIVGLGIAKDFGISWDEIHHRESGQRIVVYLIKFFGLDNIRPIPPDCMNTIIIKKDMVRYLIQYL